MQVNVDIRQGQLFCFWLLCVITQVRGQQCTGQCQCPPTVPHCPAGVSLMSGSCGCCQVCARQEGETCSEGLPCDTSRGLQCDYSASFPGGMGECVGLDKLGCEVNGVRLEEGQVFQQSCAQLCRCLGGGLSCVPLCGDDLQVPPEASCPSPRLVRLPGRCCKEWVCNSLDNTEQRRQDYEGGLSARPFGPVSNCIEWTSDWSPCSHSCGPGVSTRTTTRYWGCRLQTETRLCQVRPCHNPLPGLQRLQPGLGPCESTYTSLLSVHLEHQGCWSTRAYRPRFCALSCPERHCCSPAHTRTARVLFRCPRGRLIQQQVMMIESCSCSISACQQASRRILPWL